MLILWGRGSYCVLWRGAVCPTRAVAGTYRDLEFMVKHTEKLASRLAVLSRYLCSQANEKGSSVAPAGSFVPREAVLPVSNALQEEKLSLPVWPMGSLGYVVCSWASKLLKL